MKGTELLDKMELVDLSYVQAADRTSESKRNSWLKYGTIAACLCMTLLALFLGVPGSGNTFAVKACALEMAEDGTICLNETDLLDQPDVWGGHFDGENFYAGVGLKCEGENIKEVVFTTEEGFFAKQYVGSLSAEKDISRLYVGPEHKLVMYGTEFEVVGNSITLDAGMMTDDLLLFWGTSAKDFSEVPESVDIKAVAAFQNGKTQEILISLDFSGTGVASAPVDKAFLEQHKKQFDYYMSLPLDSLELVDGSVETVTEVYEIDLGTEVSWITIDDHMEFNEDGIYRGGTRGSGRGDVYIPVIRQESNGVYTGMLYRVPEKLHYNQK